MLDFRGLLARLFSPSGNGNHGRRRAPVRLTVEQLETRELLSITPVSGALLPYSASSQHLDAQKAIASDKDNTVAEAINLGTLIEGRTYTKSGKIDYGAMPSSREPSWGLYRALNTLDVDLYKFTVAAGDRVTFKVATTEVTRTWLYPEPHNIHHRLNVRLMILDGNGVNPSSYDNGGPTGIGGDGVLAHTFNKSGTYYLGVSSDTQTQYNILSGNTKLVNGQRTSIGPYTFTITTTKDLPDLAALGARLDDTGRRLFFDYEVSQPEYPSRNRPADWKHDVGLYWSDASGNTYGQINHPDIDGYNRNTDFGFRGTTTKRQFSIPVSALGIPPSPAATHIKFLLNAKGVVAEPPRYNNSSICAHGIGLRVKEIHAYDDITIDGIGDKVYGVMPAANSKPIADNIGTSFTLEVHFDAGTGAFPSGPYQVDYSWKIVGTTKNIVGTTKSGAGTFSLLAWDSDHKGRLTIKMPTAVGQYEVDLDFKIKDAKGNIVGNPEVPNLRLLATYGTPIINPKINPSAQVKLEWLEKGTLWASGATTDTQVLAGILTGIYKESKWKYRAPLNSDLLANNATKDWTLLDGLGLSPGDSKQAGNCFTFAQAWAGLSNSLGVQAETSTFDNYDKYFVVTEGAKSLDGQTGNARPLGKPMYDCWVFLAHQVGYYKGSYYDPTFGVTEHGSVESPASKTFFVAALGTAGQSSFTAGGRTYTKVGKTDSNFNSWEYVSSDQTTPPPYNKMDIYAPFVAELDNSFAGHRGQSPTVTKGAAFTTGVNGQAVDLTSGGYLQYANAGNLDSRKGTVEFWIRPNWNGNRNATHVFFNAGRDFDSGMLMSIDGTNNLRFIQWGDDRATAAVETHVERGVAASGANWKAGNWYHVAGAWDGVTGAMSLYVNGSLVSSINNGVKINSFATNQFTLGADQYLRQQAFGVFDEVRISNKMRTKDEIFASFASVTPSTSPPSQPLQYAPPSFDGRVGQIWVYNPFTQPMRVTLWHPGSRAPLAPWTIQPGAKVCLSSGDPLTIGSDWGIQLNELHVVPVGRASNGIHYFDVNLASLLS